MNDILDPQVQRKLAIHTLFTGPGWKIFESQLKEFLEVDECALGNLMQGMVANENLQKFNFLLGKKQAFQAVLSIKEMLLEELEDENSPEKA